MIIPSITIREILFSCGCKRFISVALNNGMNLARMISRIEYREELKGCKLLIYDKNRTFPFSITKSVGNHWNFSLVKLSLFLGG